MTYLSRLLWLLPFAVHVGFGAAVFFHFPDHIGQTVDSEGVPLLQFYALWYSTVILADGAFVLLYLRMPHLKDRMFSVPGKQYWLSTPENRMTLISRLRGIIESSLLGLNLFFLAVFQAIYQANTLSPAVVVDMPVLFVGFMLIPLLLVGIHFVLSVLALKRISSRPSVF